MIKPQKSLSRKLSVTIILMAVPIFVLAMGIFYFWSRELYHQKSAERVFSIQRTAMQRIVKYMGAVETAAKSNSWLLEEYFTPDSLQSIAYRIVARNRSIISCSVGTEPDMFPQKVRYFSVYSFNNGDTIYSVSESGDGYYKYYEKSWYKTTRKTDKARWFNPFTDYTETTLNHSDAIASYCMPLHDSEGCIKGVLSTDCSFASLAQILSSMKLPYPNAYFILIGADGRYLIHPDKRLLFKKTVFSLGEVNDNIDLIALGHEMTSGRSGTMHLVLDNKKLHVSYSAVHGTDWSLGFVVPTEDMMGPFYLLTYVTIALIVAGLFVIMWLCYRVVQQNITPLKQLLDRTDKIARGQYDDIIPLSDKKDIVARLQNSFAAMQQAIMSHMGQIESKARKLEAYNEMQEEKLEMAELSIQRKDKFLSDVLNQMRRPIDVIRDTVQVLLDSQEIPEKELAGIASKMKYNTNQLLRMTLMIFDSSDTVAFDSSTYRRGDKVMCNQVARESIDYVQAHFVNVKVRFESEISDDFSIQTSYLFLMRTLREIVYNAAKYSDGQHICLSITKTPTTVRFTIEDVGPGLPPDSLDMIYKPFMKVDDLSDGLGLGLPLSKRHITGLGGELIYDADYKEGCRFIVELPL